MNARAIATFVFFAGVAAPPPAGAFEFATDDDGAPLHWEEDGPIGFNQAVVGGGGLPAWRLHAVARNAFDTWASIETADLQFEERYVFGGPYCPHSIPSADEQLIQAVCGTSLPDHDFRSALFFIESVWPFGSEVIALTTLSWAEGARLVDADIAYNGLDYAWTVGDTGVRVDFESINVHEIGHFLGLGHSEVPGAVMRVDYDEGDTVRVLGEDDIAGMTEMYPCASPPCRGSVSHVAPKNCAAPGAVRGGGIALALGLLVVAGIAHRRSLAPLALALAVGAWMVPAEGTSSTVLALGVEDLSARSDRVVRATVASVEPYRDGVIVRSRVELDVRENWRGGGPDRVVLDQPGGSLGGEGTIVFGMPRFVEGDDVVVFLASDAPAGLRVVGLAQGKFEVRGDRVVRDTSGLMLARVGDAPPVPLEAPEFLEALRRRALLAD